MRDTVVPFESGCADGVVVPIDPLNKLPPLLSRAITYLPDRGGRILKSDESCIANPKSRNLELDRHRGAKVQFEISGFRICNAGVVRFQDSPCPPSKLIPLSRRAMCCRIQS
jgi:hypothetical protein